MSPPERTSKIMTILDTPGIQLTRNDPLTGSCPVAYRRAEAADLEAINRVIENAVGTWALPERVKRLAMPLYRYTPIDFEHLTLWVAEHETWILGVAAWEPADPVDAPDEHSALLLHGLYVDPAVHGRGIGRRLVKEALAACEAGAFDGLLVKAQPQAASFFTACGFVPLPLLYPDRQYPHRLWASSRLGACRTREIVPPTRLTPAGPGSHNDPKASFMVSVSHR